MFGIPFLLALLVSACFSTEPLRNYSVIFDIRDGEDKIIPAKIFFLEKDIPPINTGKEYYEVILPQDLYDIYVYARGYTTWERQIHIDSDMVISVRLEKGPPSLPPISKVLLVIDNEGAEGLRYYEEALRGLYLKYDKKIGTADRATLLRYPLVIWFFGSQVNDTLNGHERRALSDYVGGGGNLIISGENLGKNLYRTFFYEKVLGAIYRRNSSWVKSLIGMEMEFDVKGEDSVDKLRSPDVLAPADSDAVSLFEYKTLGGSGAIFNHYGRGTATYLSFCFEAVSGRENRRTIVRKVRSQFNLAQTSNLLSQRLHFEQLFSPSKP
ncbi:hypothetical protein HOF92_04430 [bacterium]|jgi:hypothetical protein|nr:hypothetical protein [bacterium]